MVDRIVAALAESTVETVYAVTSPNAPETAAHLDVPTIETPGDGYVADLQEALADPRVHQPILTVVADLALLSARTIDAVLGAHEAGPMTVAVPVGRVSALGFSVDSAFHHGGIRLRPAGLNVVAPGEESTSVRRDLGLAANVNRPRDLVTARWLAAGDSLFR